MSKVDSGERGAKVRFPPPLVYLAFILLGFALRYVMLPPNADSFIMRAAGIAIVLAGFWLIAEAWKLFKRTGQDPRPWKPSPEMVLSGPYRFTRNPIYLGMMLGLIGLAVALNSLWLLLTLAPFALVIRYGVVAREEAYLERKFGDVYRHYRARVRRWL